MDGQSNNILITFTPLEIGLISAGIVLTLLFLITIAWVAYYFWRRQDRQQYLEKQLKYHRSPPQPQINIPRPLKYPPTNPAEESENVTNKKGYPVQQSFNEGSENETNKKGYPVQQSFNDDSENETNKKGYPVQQSFNEVPSQSLQFSHRESTITDVAPLSTVTQSGPGQYPYRDYYTQRDGIKDGRVHAQVASDGLKSATESPPISSLQHLSPYNYYNASEINEQIDAYINNQSIGDSTPSSAMSSGIKVTRFPVEVNTRPNIGIHKKRLG
ncbi:unnamed protein product [Owenia fusiformis]|uniref:Uncharacterized protein n=1 Tax=Owenia fusiformis TaxID=6347 RepID=A0A8J1XSL7_OWEFU|nr:unnamed protein product [Owenia fusiformis]